MCHRSSVPCSQMPCHVISEGLVHMQARTHLGVPPNKSTSSPPPPPWVEDEIVLLEEAHEGTQRFATGHFSGRRRVLRSTSAGRREADRPVRHAACDIAHPHLLL